MINLQGRTALVTGGTMGVGQAIANSLAQAGANIVLHGLLDDSAAQQAVSTIRDLGVDCQLVTADLAAPTEDAVNALFDAACSACSDIDILISNAGTYREPDFLEIDFATFERTMRLNVFSHFFLIQQFARRWVEQGTAGRVLLTGSINGRLAEQTHAAYDVKGCGGGDGQDALRFVGPAWNSSQRYGTGTGQDTIDGSGAGWGRRYRMDETPHSESAGARSGSLRSYRGVSCQ